MPMHDWNKVEAGIFHAFHHEWISEISRELNKSLLPKDYYALPEQVAAGFAVYGPATILVLTVGNGTVGFTLDRDSSSWILTQEKIEIPADTKEFAINMSNSRNWSAPVKRYIDECLAGKTGARGRDFNMRWVASMVADVFRVLSRGGIFMYPRDRREPVPGGEPSASGGVSARRAGAALAPRPWPHRSAGRRRRSAARLGV